MLQFQGVRTLRTAAEEPDAASPVNARHEHGTHERMRGPFSVLIIGALLTRSVALSLAMDLALFALSAEPPLATFGWILVFNTAALGFASVGALIEWRRPGHTVGRLLLIGGPLYAMLGAGWLTAGLLEPIVPEDVYSRLNWFGLLLSFPGVALVAGWIPLLFPTGALPGPRWRPPLATLVVLSGIGLAAWGLRPGPLVEGIDSENPFGIAGWPPILQVFVDALWPELIVLFVLAVIALVVRYRRGDVRERTQIRWFLAASSVVVAGFVGVIVEQSLRPDSGPLVSAFIAYLGLALLPIAIGVAILRYRLYDIDRIISRTVAWTLVTGTLLAVFTTALVTLQWLLAGLTEGSALSVALSTLGAAALAQPLRRRVQSAVDRRFDRDVYDGGRVLEAFGRRLRGEVELETLRGEIQQVARETVRPETAALWLRPAPVQRDHQASRP